MPLDVPTAEAVRAGDQRALARAITLVESTRTDHHAAAVALVDELLPYTGEAIRVGISGPPGVGKSTFIEALGSHLTGSGRRVAVLAVDPSSSITGGSILGDKTRMDRLARDPQAFIRPTPAGRELGGVARRTREALLLCEAAGFDVVLVETVGVGQSEIAVADLTDLFVLLASPTGGDDLQGIKRGIMELADLVLVTKADGDLAAAANHACADIRHALHLLRPRHREIPPEALLVSSVSGAGVIEAWAALETAHGVLRTSGALDRFRADQAKTWMWSQVQASVVDALRSGRGAIESVDEVERSVVEGRMSPSAGAQKLIAMLRTETQR